MQNNEEKVQKYHVPDRLGTECGGCSLQYAPVTQLHTDVLGEIRVGFDQLSGKG